MKSYRLVADSLFELVLEAPLPDINIKNEAILADNYDNSPSVTVRNNHFGACRARGLLLVTPKPVVIEDNIFESGGAAIMLSNDTSFWYNSGCCTDVTVRNQCFFRRLLPLHLPVQLCGHNGASGHSASLCRYSVQPWDRDREQPLYVLRHADPLRIRDRGAGIPSQPDIPHRPCAYKIFRKKPVHIEILPQCAHLRQSDGRRILA